MLPALPPKPKESLSAYLKRLGTQPSQYEVPGISLNLERYTATGEGDKAEEPRSPGELMITLDSPMCEA